MNARIFAYCERGLDPGFWAEPLNALSNAAFLIGAWSAWRAWKRSAEAGRTELGLVALLAAIGIGSFLFHTFATRWAALADVVPIGIFMLAYFAYALRRFLRLHHWQVVLGVMAFGAAIALAGQVRCGGIPCLNSSVGYLPALGALMAVGGMLVHRGHAAGRMVLGAGCLLALSLVFRTIDRTVCPWTIIAARSIGTHVLWHLLNAVLLGLLVHAAIRHGARSR